MTTPINRLVHEFAKLPGVGEKTAQRFAFHVLRQKPEYAKALSQALLDVKDRIRFCSRCFALTEQDPCATCLDPKRDHGIICVVEEPSDMMAIEATRVFRGDYHVLHGALSPLDGIGPEDIRVTELLERLSRETIDEVVVATNINVEGEATALYINRLLKPTGIKLTRLASGVPFGGDLEYIDATTLTRAFEERHEL